MVVHEPVELDEDNSVDEQLDEYEMDDQIEDEIDDQHDEDEIDDPEPPSPRTNLANMVTLGIEDAIIEALVIDANSIVLDAYSLVFVAIRWFLVPISGCYPKAEIGFESDGFNYGIDEPVHEYGYSALHLAVMHSHLDCVELLVGRGANLEVDVDGVSPLHSACSDNGFDDMAQLLLRSANDPERVTRMLAAVDRNGNTPLHYAARFDHEDIITSLLDSGATPTPTNNIGRTPFDLAQPNTEARRILEEAAQDNN